MRQPNLLLFVLIALTLISTACSTEQVRLLKRKNPVNENGIQQQKQHIQHPYLYQQQQHHLQQQNLHQHQQRQQQHPQPIHPTLLSLSYSLNSNENRNKHRTINQQQLLKGRTQSNPQALNNRHPQSQLNPMSLTNVDQRLGSSHFKFADHDRKNLLNAIAKQPAYGTREARPANHKDTKMTKLRSNLETKKKSQDTNVPLVDASKSKANELQSKPTSVGSSRKGSRNGATTDKNKNNINNKTKNQTNIESKTELVNNNKTSNQADIKSKPKLRKPEFLNNENFPPKTFKQKVIEDPIVEFVGLKKADKIAPVKPQASADAATPLPVKPSPRETRKGRKTSQVAIVSESQSHKKESSKLAPTITKSAVHDGFIGDAFIG